MDLEKAMEIAKDLMEKYGEDFQVDLCKNMAGDYEITIKKEPEYEEEDDHRTISSALLDKYRP